MDGMYIMPLVYSNVLTTLTSSLSGVWNVFAISETLKNERNMQNFYNHRKKNITLFFVPFSKQTHFSVSNDFSLKINGIVV